MTEVRQCRHCETVERRWLEEGRERVNLDPVSGLCVECLGKDAKQQQRLVREAPASSWVDHRSLRAGEGRDEV